MFCQTDVAGGRRPTPLWRRSHSAPGEIMLLLTSHDDDCFVPIQCSTNRGVELLQGKKTASELISSKYAFLTRVTGLYRQTS
jgi:hypothetical protein